MHVHKGKTIAQCLTDRTDYAENPDKTENGELISSYACDHHTADAEFLLSKRQYKILTGREQRNDVITYQVRQSFKSGEVTPEEANKIGFEFAQRFLKGKHAFIVATHADIYAQIDPKTVQYLAGHENSKITMDIYAKVKYNKPHELVTVVNNAFGQ